MENLKDIEEELEREREKLHQLINEVKHAPILKNEAIIEQSRKVDILIARIQKAKGKINKSNEEHPR